MNDAAVEQAPASNAGKKIILVVEDERLVRAMFSEALRELGYSVIEAVSADEVASVLRSHLKVDIVIKDMRVPGTMDGKALVRWVRTQLSSRLADLEAATAVARFAAAVTTESNSSSVSDDHGPGVP